MRENEKSDSRDIFAASRLPEFRSFILMRFFFTFSFQMQTIILGYYVYELTKDPMSLGLIGLFEAIPSIGIALYGGYVVDKYDKRKLLVMILLGFILCSTVILIVTVPYFKFSQISILCLIYAMVFGIGICRGFIRPATFAIMSQLVPKEHYANSTTWYNSSGQVASILGPMAGGFIYGIFGISFAFLAVLSLLILSFITIFFLKSQPPATTMQGSLSESLMQGLRFVTSNKMMLGAMSLDFFSVFFGGAIALLPVFAETILKVGSEGLGLLRSAEAIGAISCLFFLTKLPVMNKPWRNLLVAVTGFGLSIICFGFSKNFYISLVSLFFIGAFDSVSVVIRSTIMQLITPVGMRGRVSAINSVFIGSSNEIGAFESGVTAKLMTLVPAVIFGGSMTIFVAFVAWTKTKKLMKLELKDLNSEEHV